MINYYKTTLENSEISLDEQEHFMTKVFYELAVNYVGSAADFLAAIEGTIKNFNDGDLVAGVVVQVDREEVLLDIGYKTEGVIPSRELSIRHDIDPSEIVAV